MVDLEAITACVLLYGDTPECAKLARRCLSSLTASRVDGFQVRVAMNAVGEATRDYVAELHAAGYLATVPDDSTQNRLKYPVMRRFLYGPDPVDTPLFMWFDDDSFVREPLSVWLPKVRHALQHAHMIGAPYQIRLAGRQHEWIKRQAWYTGKPVLPRMVVRFLTGGWWCLRTELLRRHDWPSPEIRHRGGDVMLGELCRQQDYLRGGFTTGVAINAGDTGVICTSVQRGFDEKPIGYNL